MKNKLAPSYHNIPESFTIMWESEQATIYWSNMHNRYLLYEIPQYGGEEQFYCYGESVEYLIKVSEEKFT